MRKIIFLDVDGVLNSNAYFDRIEKYKSILDHIDIEAVKRLQKIVDNTGAKIVLSSTWRFNYYDKLKEWFNNNGFTIDIIDKTKRGCSDCVRGNEIRAWLKDNVKRDGAGVEPVTYCILDDDNDMLVWQKDYFINTDNQYGLTDIDTNKAIEILNSTKPVYF
jgi:hypothetical protein